MKILRKKNIFVKKCRELLKEEKFKKTIFFLVVRDFGHASKSTGIGHHWPILDHNYWPIPDHDDSPMLPEEHWPTPADYELTEPQAQIPEEREIGIDERSVRYSAADRGKGILHEGGASTAAGQGISPATFSEYVHHDANPQPEEYQPTGNCG
jgi:hypothetical protein